MPLCAAYELLFVGVQLHFPGCLMSANKISSDAVKICDDTEGAIFNSNTRDWLLEKVRNVANLIAFRVKRVAEDTHLDLPALSDDATREETPLATPESTSEHRVLHCMNCNASRIIGEAEHDQYSIAGFPSCCGRTMTLSLDASR